MSTQRNQYGYALHHLIQQTSSTYNDDIDDQNIIRYTTPNLNAIPIPPDTESGNVELAQRVILKLSQMMVITEYNSDPRWKWILSMQSIKSYKKQYLAWELMQRLEQDILNKRIIRINNRMNIVKNNPSKNNIQNECDNFDPDDEFVICTVAYVDRTITQQKSMQFENICKTIYVVNKIDEETRQQLIGAHFFADNFLQSARCIFGTHNQVFFVAINVNQVRFISMERGAYIKSVLHRLQTTVSFIQKRFANFKCNHYKIDILMYGISRCVARYIHHDIIRLCVQYYGTGTNVGYATGCDERCRLFVRMKIPLTAHHKHLFNEKKRNKNLQIGGNIYGRHFGPKGSIYDVSIVTQLDQGKELNHLIDGCKDFIQTEQKLQVQQISKIKRHWPVIRKHKRGFHLNKMNKKEFAGLTVRILNNGEEEQVSKKMLELHLLPYTLLINESGTTPEDIGHSKSGKAVTIMKYIKNYVETRRLAEKAIKTKAPCRERGVGYKKRFIYQIEGQEVTLGPNGRTVVEDPRFIAEPNEHDIQASVNMAIASACKLEMTALIFLLKELFVYINIRDIDCDIYIGKYDKYDAHFKAIANSLLKCDDNTLKLQAMIRQLSKCTNNVIEVENKICWIHFISCCCIVLIEKQNNNNINININNEWNMKVLNYLFDLLLQCICCNEYHALFVSPNTLITDVILTFIAIVNKHNVCDLFKRDLNHDIFAYGIIKSPYLLKLLKHYSDDSMKTTMQQALHQTSQSSFEIVQSAAAKDTENKRLNSQILSYAIDNNELLAILSDKAALTNKINEALAVLKYLPKTGNKWL